MWTPLYALFDETFNRYRYTVVTLPAVSSHATSTLSLHGILRPANVLQSRPNQLNTNSASMCNQHKWTATANYVPLSMCFKLSQISWKSTLMLWWWNYIPIENSRCAVIRYIGDRQCSSCESSSSFEQQSMCWQWLSVLESPAQQIHTWCSSPSKVRKHFRKQASCSGCGFPLLLFCLKCCCLRYIWL